MQVTTLAEDMSNRGLDTRFFGALKCQDQEEEDASSREGEDKELRDILQETQWTWGTVRLPEKWTALVKSTLLLEETSCIVHS